MAKGKSNHVDVEGGRKADRDELAQLIVDTANRSQKDGSRVAYFLDEQEDPSMVSDWISTGSSMLDLAISNRKNGGLPVGRIAELNGLEGTGKSLLAAHIIADTQRKGGVGVMIDTENAAAPAFWTAVGCDLRNLPYFQLVTVEEIFNKMEELIGIVRKSSKDRLCTIIVDSLAQASTASEMESEHGAKGYNTQKAIIISMACRKILGLIGKQRILPVFTNQLRMNMATFGHGDKWVVPGGKAMGFAASVRVRLTTTATLKNSKKEVIGNSCKAIVTKNRMGPPKRVAEFDIHYDSGIQDLSSWLTFMKEKGMVSGTSAKYKLKLESGEETFSTQEFVERVNADAEFKDRVYSAICDRQIMAYRDPNSKIVDDVVSDDSVEDED